MPFRIDLLAIPSFQLVGEVRTELEAPVADSFIAEHNATLGHHQLDVSIAQAEAKVQPNAVRDNLAREAMTAVQVRRQVHLISMPRLGASRTLTNAFYGFCCSNEQGNSSGERIAPNRTEVVTEMSGNTELPFEDLLHEFDTDQNPSRVVEALEAEHWLNTEFHAPMVLLHNIIQVLTRADLNRVFPAVVELVAHAHPAERGMAGFEAIQRDGSRLPVPLESLPKESFGCGHIPCTAEV
jgi:hypothetical protein